jgi:BolA protein
MLLRNPSLLLIASSKTRKIAFFTKEATKIIMTTRDFASFPVTESIKSKLEDAFAPTSYLEIINESHKHNVPDNSETHFKVVLVSPVFNSCKNLIQRHRLVNEALREELAGPVHALSIVAKSPEQWEVMKAEGKSVPPSPNCRGGDGSLSSSRMLR